MASGVIIDLCTPQSFSSLRGKPYFAFSHDNIQCFLKDCFPYKDQKSLSFEGTTGTHSQRLFRTELRPPIRRSGRNRKLVGGEKRWEEREEREIIISLPLSSPPPPHLGHFFLLPPLFFLSDGPFFLLFILWRGRRRRRWVMPLGPCWPHNNTIHNNNNEELPAGPMNYGSIIASPSLPPPPARPY